jgi:hypothetical protein
MQASKRLRSAEFLLNIKALLSIPRFASLSMMSYASFLPTAGALPEVLQLLDNTGLRAQSATEK